MYVGAIGMGFTTQDLESMPVDRLMYFIHVNNLLQGGDEGEPESRPGTIAALKRIL